VHFTREPVIETIITPREGFKLVIRNSKGVGQEEFYVDSVEVASFGHSLFFRSLEKPKAFLLPVSDYDVLEIRDTRVVLKYPTIEKTIKIGGKEKAKEKKVSKKEKVVENKEETPKKVVEEDASKVVAPKVAAPKAALPKEEPLVEKKRERRKNTRRRRPTSQEEKTSEDKNIEAPKVEEKSVKTDKGGGESDEAKDVSSSQVQIRILPPPKTLISDSLIFAERKRELEKSILSDGVKEAGLSSPTKVVEAVVEQEQSDFVKAEEDFVSVLDQKVVSDSAEELEDPSLSTFSSILEEEFGE